ncbi:hypothetical protein, partial [Burkholderia sp. SIMBA_052]|uniref:hypothetical protein n=1 Tax=Burkholderia sp. SIMBA_052 TaxID=3085793 RepID=UPI0039783BF9
MRIGFACSRHDMECRHGFLLREPYTGGGKSIGFERADTKSATGNGQTITNFAAFVPSSLDRRVKLSHIGGIMKVSDADILIIPGYTNSG